MERGAAIGTLGLTPLQFHGCNYLSMRFEVGVVGCSNGVDIFDIQSGTLLRSISAQGASGVFATLGEDHVIVSQANKVLVF